MKKVDKSQIVGWIAVSISTIITSIWAFWGMIENFHEGWYQTTLFANLGLMLVQYLSPMILFMAATLIAIRWRRVGAGLHFLIALAAIGFFNAFSNAATFLIILPLIGLGLLYWFGALPDKRWAYRVAIIIPVLTLVASGIEPIIRILQRNIDDSLQAELVQGNGVVLIWAPDGLGWPRKGTNWDEAIRTCQYLSEDGISLVESPQEIWRLPTVDEVVRSMTRRGENSAGSWHEEQAQASYEIRPDKESPLWNVYSQVIYWWTATSVDEEHAFMIAYDGKVWPRAKLTGLPYMGFRCVKSP